MAVAGIVALGVVIGVAGWFLAQADVGTGERSGEFTLELEPGVFSTLNGDQHWPLGGSTSLRQFLWIHEMSEERGELIGAEVGGRFVGRALLLGRDTAYLGLEATLRWWLAYFAVHVEARQEFLMQRRDSDLIGGTDAPWGQRFVVGQGVDVGVPWNRRWFFTLQATAYPWVDGSWDLLRFCLSAAHNALVIRTQFDIHGSWGGWTALVSAGGRAPW